jgi:trigger factor
MQVSVETTQGLERKMTISVPAADIDNEIRKRIQQLAKTQRIPGFRPGKIPLKVITKRYGEAVKHEVYTEVMQQNYYQAVIQQKINPAGAPRVEPLEAEGDDFQFTAVFEIYPEIEITDLEKLKVKTAVASVTDEDVDNMLSTLRKQRADWESVKRMAKKGDQVVTDFDGTLEGEPFEGGKGEAVAIVLGEGKMLPDFEAGLMKIKTGEEREIDVTFPDDYQAENLAGKTAQFKIKAVDVKAQKLPPLDEEFVKEFGIEDGSVESFKTEVRGNMERELAQTLASQNKSTVLDAVAKASKTEIPKAMLDSEIDRLRQQMSKQIQGQEALPELPATLFEEQAKKRVTLGLVMSELIKKESLKADAEKVKQTIEQMASAYDEPEQVTNWYYSDKNRLAEIESLVLEDAVVEFILDKAMVTETKNTFDQIMNPKS